MKRERPEQAGDGGIDGGGVIFKVRKVMDGVRPSIILDKRKGRSKKKSKSKWLCGIKVGPSLLSSRMRFFFSFRCSHCLTPEDPAIITDRKWSRQRGGRILKKKKKKKKFLEKSICSRLERYKGSQHCTRHRR